MKLRSKIIARDYKFSYFGDHGCTTIELKKGTKIKVLGSFNNEYGVWSKIKLGQYSYPVRAEDID